MFSKKVLVACYIYSFDYSKESLELNELMFRSVPVKKRWRKYFLKIILDKTRLKLGGYSINTTERGIAMSNRLKKLRKEKLDECSDYI